VTPLVWLAAKTERIKVGTAVMQMPARTPAMTAMTAATIDLLTGGRLLLGLGVSGPQVLKGGMAFLMAKRSAELENTSRSSRASWPDAAPSNTTASITTYRSEAAPAWENRSS
jgi:alkanesulfonate monooxygenase SsuD/methylene tetrahydromethanopterin reductase-like flavin-dependent oxidoreductase (luciferase family)